MMPEEQVPSRAQIEWSLAGIIRRIATGAVQPRVGLSELVTTYHGSPDLDDGGFVGQEYGIAQLIGYFYGYDDLEERPAEVSFEGHSGARAIAALDVEIVRLARAWLAERGA
jgi:hypothetical protein